MKKLLAALLLFAAPAYAADVVVGDIVNESGDTVSIASDDNLTANSVTNIDSDSGNIILTATNGDINVTDNVLNYSISGDVALDATNNISIGGNVENSGAAIYLAAMNNIYIGGTVKSDTPAGGYLHINGGGNLHIAGGDANNASLVAKSDTYIGFYDGEVRFDYGIDIGAMQVYDFFGLDAGTLVMDREHTTRLLHNRLDRYYVNILSGDLAADSVYNGTYLGDFATLSDWNPTASGDVLARNIDISGELINIGGYFDIGTHEGDGVINIGGNVWTGTTDGATLMDGSNSQTVIWGYNGTTVNIGGSIWGANEFSRIFGMTVGGNWNFGDTSALHAQIVAGSDYFSTVNTDASSANHGVITNQPGADALSVVAGDFISDLTGDAGISISIYDELSTSDAIWLIHANSVIQNGTQLRDVGVQFCNAYGSDCFDYLSTLRDPDTGALIGSDNPDNLPAYLTVRDTDGDGVDDSVYVVFDPAVGGPLNVFKIEPIVAKTDSRTAADMVVAGALDNMVAGQISRKGFNSVSPLEVIPHVFADSIFAQLGNELYTLMEYYSTSRDGALLTELSHKFQPRELDMMSDMSRVARASETQIFYDHMWDEFLTNRARDRNKIWADFSFGDWTGGDHWTAYLGYDAQYTHDTIVGGFARVSGLSGSMDFSEISVDNTRVGAGVYFLDYINQNAQWYGNLSLNMDMYNVERNQELVGKVSGDATGFSVLAELGALHNIWLNYIVGNAHLRTGIDMGASGDWMVDGQKYMNISGGTNFILTPGYDLILNRKFYIGSWAWLRAAVSAGVEYDVINSDSYGFKFAPAENYTNWETDTGAFWYKLNGGLELAGATGWSVGFDYTRRSNGDITANDYRINAAVRF